MTQISSDTFGEFLVAKKKLTASDLQSVSNMQVKDSIGALLVKMGMLSERDLAEAMAEFYTLPLLEKVQFPDTPIIEQNLPSKYLRHNLVLPLSVTESQLEVAVADPANESIKTALRLSTGKEIVFHVAVASEIHEALELLYGQGRSQMDQIIEGSNADEQQARPEDIAQLKDMASEAPVIRLVNLIIQRAVELRASDIHIEPFVKQMKVRYRVDGILREVESPPVQLYAAVISRIKIMANLDIAERRLPQDGRIRTKLLGIETDLRVSTVPTLFGESLVLRLLYKEHQSFDFDLLGFDQQQLERLENLLRLPHGILLVTGPTGSGKTTTLYAALNVLNEPTRKILTVEDPVEYQLEGINQIQVKPQIGLTFANALRSIVRQDPDVILIGEMRDRETAEIAVQSALTGHLVLSTLHTNDAASSITRLQDMGIAGYLVNSVLNGVLAQRLVRKLCSHCKASYEVPVEMMVETGLDKLIDDKNAKLFRSQGCDQCNGTGYVGRTALLEILSITDQIRQLVLSHADAHEINQAAINEGMRSLYQDGLIKALAGITSLEEVMRVTRN